MQWNVANGESYSDWWEANLEPFREVAALAKKAYENGEIDFHLPKEHYLHDQVEVFMKFLPDDKIKGQPGISGDSVAEYKKKVLATLARRGQGEVASAKAFYPMPPAGKGSKVGPVSSSSVSKTKAQTKSAQTKSGSKANANKFEISMRDDDEKEEENEDEDEDGEYEVEEGYEDDE